MPISLGMTMNDHLYKIMVGIDLDTPAVSSPPKSIIKSSHGYNIGVRVGSVICTEKLIGLVYIKN